MKKKKIVLGILFCSIFSFLIGVLFSWFYFDVEWNGILIYALKKDVEAYRNINSNCQKTLCIYTTNCRLLNESEKDDILSNQFWTINRELYIPKCKSEYCD